MELDTDERTGFLGVHLHTLSYAFLSLLFAK